MSSQLTEYLSASHSHTDKAESSSGQSYNVESRKESQEDFQELHELEREKAKLKRAMVEQRERDRERMDALRELIETLRAAQRGLHSMIRAVSLSNGSSWIEASTALDDSTRLLKLALPLSFPATPPSANIAYPPFSDGERGVETGFGPAPLSIVESLRLKSPEDICALGLWAPIIIATDRAATSTLDLKGSVGQIPASLHPCTPPSRAYTVRVKPVLDVVGVKVCSFKNSISAIKMFLSARTIVSNN